MMDLVIANRARLIFYVLNLSLVIPFLVKNYSHWALGGAFAILLIAFYFTVTKPKGAAPAAGDVPLLLFFDVSLCLVVSYQELIDNYNIGNLMCFIENVEGDCLFLLIGGLAISLFTPKKPNALWLRCIGKTAMGAFVIMQIWSNGNIAEPEFYNGGDILMASYLLFAIVWSVFCIVSAHVNPSAYKRNNWLSNFLILIFALFCTIENDLIQNFIPQVEAYLWTIPTMGLAWWKVILSAAVLAGCAIGAFDYRNNTMGVDALILSFVASALVILRVLLANYFSFSWVVFAVFVVSCVKCIKNEARGKRTLRLSALGYTVVQFAALLISIWLIKAGLWINLIVICTYTLMFYSAAGKEINEKHKLRHWLEILSVPAVYAIAYVWQMCFSMDAIVLIVLAYVCSAGVMVILSWPHPDKVAVPRRYKIIICAMLVLLCWIAMGRYGAKVDVEFDAVKNTAIVEIDAKGKNNDIESVEYQWSAITGEPIEGVISMGKNGSSIPVLGEVLTIIVTDSHGVVTTKTEWYPHWLISR